MIRQLAITLYVLFQTTLCGCGKDHRQSEFEVLRDAYEIKRIGTLPPAVPECSGLALAHDDSTFWTHNDAGNSSELFRIDYTGKLVQRVRIEGAKNKDWEELAKDDSGHLYVCDFGNNNNARRELVIYKVREEDRKLVGEIRYSYPDQTAFPPPKQERNFDCEAAIWRDGHLYLFSKDRGKKRLVKLYQLPDQPGEYQAQLIDSLKLNTLITGADISPDGNTIAVLGYGKIFLFEVEAGQSIYDGQRYCIPFARGGQAEAIVFVNNSDFYFSNEQGKLYAAKRKNKTR